MTTQIVPQQPAQGNPPKLTSERYPGERQYLIEFLRDGYYSIPDMRLRIAVVLSTIDTIYPPVWEEMNELRTVRHEIDSYLSRYLSVFLGATRKGREQ